MMVRVYDNDVEKALKVFKRQLQREGFFKELKQRRFYEKPSDRRKRKQKQARRKMLKIQRSM
jgi:small subunit ribosomal protein S21